MKDNRRHKRYTLKVMEVEGKVMFASQVNIIDISIDGISLKANRRLNIGSEYLLKLDDRKKAISLRGTVVWSSLSESKKSRGGGLVPIYRVGMKFNNVSVEKINELLEFIEGHKKEEVPATGGKRLNVRFLMKDPANATLNFPAMYRVKTISLGGMLIECKRDLLVDSRIPMELSVHNDQPVQFVGRVVSCNVSGIGQGLYDIGIEFLGLTDRYRELLKTFIEYCDVMETRSEAETADDGAVDEKEPSAGAIPVDPMPVKEQDTGPVSSAGTGTEPVKVVVHYSDGRLLKGHTNDFSPVRPSFHVLPAGFGPADKGIEVTAKELKALFFVKDFTGDRAYYEKKEFAEGQQLSGRKVEVTFADGEVLVGSVLGYDPHRFGFFVTPPDPGSNNLRVFVVSAAVRNFRFL